MPTNPLYSFLSSSLVKDVVKWGGDASPYVPDFVGERLKTRLRRTDSRLTPGPTRRWRSSGRALSGPIMGVGKTQQYDRR